MQTSYTNARMINMTVNALNIIIHTTIQTWGYHCIRVCVGRQISQCFIILGKY